MRTLLSPFFLALAIISFQQAEAQQRPARRSNTLILNWQSIQKIRSENGLISQLTCMECGIMGSNPRVPVVQQLFPGETIQDLSLEGSSWEEIPFWEIAGLDTQAISSRISPVEWEQLEVEKKLSSRSFVVPIRKNGGRWEKATTLVLHKKAVASSQPSVPTRIATASNSIFSSGNFVKIGIVKDGVYQLTAADLQANGLDLSGRLSSQIKLYGSGGKILSEANRDYNFAEIPELPIWVDDGGDGIFNSTDKIYFYGQDPHTWTFNLGRVAYEFSPNIYSDTSYYFVTVSPGSGKRVEISNTSAPADQIVNSYIERWVYSPEKVNVASFGRIWYADVLDFTTTKDISFEAQGLTTTSNLKFRIGVMARSAVAYGFQCKVNGENLGDPITPSPVSLSAVYGVYGSNRIETREITSPGNQATLNFSINYLKSGNPQSLGYINFVEMNGERSLSWNNKNFNFRSGTIQNIHSGFEIANLPADARVWDVSRNGSIRQLVPVANRYISFQDTLKEYSAFVPSLCPRPALLKPVANQNLKGMASPNLVIVSHPLFLEQAYRLADFRRRNDNLEVEVVTLEQIYNEYSSGAQDITAIRNFAMDLYYKEETSKFRYLLLFGDCSYDYKNRIPNNTNYIPTYSSNESLYIIGSYASDDYFGILSRTKGGWGANDLMEIGVGRLPAKSKEEARIMVDKLIRYSSDTLTLGNWRNRYTFLADDKDYCTHSRQANALATSVQNQNASSLIKKIYIGAYEKIVGAGGERSPEANNDLLNTFDKGSLIVNYTGHGGETVLADEFLLTSEMIEQLENKYRLPFFITATCDFGRHDYPTQVSGAESLVLQENGGAIGVVTTGRPVIADNNFSINQSYFSNIYNPVEGRPGRLGDAMREAKNKNGDKASNRGFTLLGDPSGRLAFPEEDIVITKMPPNNEIKGLDLVEFEGEVRKDGVIDSVFNGRVFPTILDKPGTITVVDPVYCDNYNYSADLSTLFNGSARVVNGKFKFQFMASKDISFAPGNGRLSMYAQDAKRNKDAAGNRTDLLVGGFNPNPVTDNEGPIIRPFMNDTTFVSGGLVGPNAVFIGFFEDDPSGINTSGLGLGHDLMMTLDGNQIFILNDFYQTAEGDHTKGSVRFPLYNLSEGHHTLVIRAWDNSNNSSEAILEFEVGTLEVLGKIAKNMVLYPNPFTEELRLQFDNAYAGKSIDIEMRVTDVLGREVTRLEWTIGNSSSRPGTDNELMWNGLKADGTKLENGTYFCQIRLKSNTDGAEFKINQKIIRLH